MISRNLNKGDTNTLQIQTLDYEDKLLKTNKRTIEQTWINSRFINGYGIPARVSTKGAIALRHYSDQKFAIYTLLTRTLL